MNNYKLSLLAVSTAMILGTMTGCGDYTRTSDDPDPTDIPKAIETTYAEISGTAVKGTFENAVVSFEQLNGSNLNVIAGENTDSIGNALVEVAGDEGFGIGSVIKVSVTAMGDTVMACDAASCGSASWGSSISGSALDGAELLSYIYLDVPYGNGADTQADVSFKANAFTTMASRLIADDIAAGKNVSTPELLLAAQAKYSALVFRALGYDDRKTNVFTEQFLSVESFDNLIEGQDCEFVQATDENGDPLFDENEEPIYVVAVDENGDPILDGNGNETYEESCENIWHSDEKILLSVLNSSFAHFESGYTQQSVFDSSYTNLRAAIDGNEDALVALREFHAAAIDASPIMQGFGIGADYFIDMELPLFNEATASGPVHEITTAENMATAIITTRDANGAGEAGPKAFDGDVNSKWLDPNGWSGPAPTAEEPSWIQVQFAEAQAVNSLFITSANDAPERDPENFNIQGSNDGENWVKLADFIGESFDERFERKEFRFSNGIEYSYYRVNITKDKGNSNLMQIAEISMVGPIYTSVDHTKPVGTGTITTRDANGAGEAGTMAFDGDANTKWLDPNGWSGPAPTDEDPSWAQVDFDMPVAVSVLGLTSANDGPERDPENFNVQGSNDGGTTWVTVGTWLGESFDERFERKLFNFDNTLAFSSYRFNVTKNKGNSNLMQIAEIEFIGPKMPDQNHGMTVGVDITARDANGAGEAGDKAFDGDVNTKWLDPNGWSGPAPTVEEPSWVQVQLPEAATVNKVALTSANDASERDPENFDLQGSADGETWVVLSSWLGESFDERFERKIFSFSNDLAFSYYRFNITKNKGNSNLMQVAEIELIGPEYSSIDHSSTEGVVITARDQNGDGEAGSKSFDDDVNTKWLDPNGWSGPAPSDEDPSWVQVDLPSAKIVSSIAITSANDASERDPENFNVQGSNDGGVTWTTVGSWLGESWDNRYERKLFDMGNGFAFESYRVNITKNKGNSNLMQIAEIELIGPDL